MVINFGKRENIKLAMARNMKKEAIMTTKAVM